MNFWIILLGVAVIFGLFFVYNRKRQIRNAQAEREARPEDKPQEEEWDIGTWTLGMIIPYIVIAILAVITHRNVLLIASAILLILRLRAGYAQYRINRKGNTDMFSRVLGVRTQLAASRAVPSQSVIILQKFAEEAESPDAKALASVFNDIKHRATANVWHNSLQRALEVYAGLSMIDMKIGDTFRDTAGGVVFMHSLGYATLSAIILFLNQYITPASEGLIIILMIVAHGLCYLFEEITYI